MHDDQRDPTDRLLEQVLCGERPADDSEFAAALERDPRARERWERLRKLSSSLDQIGETERGVRAEARRSSGSDAADERVSELVRAHFAPPTGFKPWRLPWLWSGLLAAGLALTLWFGQRDSAGDPAATGAGQPGHFDSIVLSEGSPAFAELIALPLGDRSYQLSWSDSEAAFGRTYFVRLFEREGDLIGAALPHLHSDELLDPTWTLDVPATLDPQRLAWSVEARAVDGEVVAASEVRLLVAPR